ncbi:predicted protein [Histoplasma capsulatum G186AR]|uniref:Uncharacterized protein n=1 Tax=Ajellomyces capsulatus (strain G186AR / H82 / ATCC MYA-2454 / RMSCC 2432) TaxID=447093 RepID=C0NMZ0_AJECG|nr:uncharacterized protein HCBG_04117 [Histoplasma capsulatum G186AR]EEH07238.1 predicted protein [Histoplasma capsulatum G186AR]
MPQPYGRDTGTAQGSQSNCSSTQVTHAWGGRISADSTWAQDFFSGQLQAEVGTTRRSSSTDGLLSRLTGRLQRPFCVSKENSVVVWYVADGRRKGGRDSKADNTRGLRGQQSAKSDHLGALLKTIGDKQHTTTILKGRRAAGGGDSTSLNEIASELPRVRTAANEPTATHQQVDHGRAPKRPQGEKKAPKSFWKTAGGPCTGDMAPANDFSNQSRLGGPIQPNRLVASRLGGWWHTRQPGAARGQLKPSALQANIDRLTNVADFRTAEKTCNHSKLGGYLARSIVSKVKSWRIRLERRIDAPAGKRTSTADKVESVRHVDQSSPPPNKKTNFNRSCEKGLPNECIIQQGCGLLWKLTTQPKITWIHAF